MIEEREEARLAAALHPLSQSPEQLPVGGYRPSAGQKDWRPRDAVVLVPILRESEEILLTVRSHALTSHAGQISFPGGAVDPEDASTVDTALREAFEEVAIPPEKVHPLGYLDCFMTLTGFRMVPVVGLVEHVDDLRANPAEVSEIFTIPLAHALDAARYRYHRVTWKGDTARIATLEHPKHFIWGATAAVLDCLRRRIDSRNSEDCGVSFL